MLLYPPSGDESNEALVEIVASEIDATGPITFARFMELVVRDPKFGYYAASTKRVGVAGDFLTAPETHPLFGWLLGDQVIDIWQLLGSPPEFAVVEDGAGRGTLARQIIDRILADPPAGLQTLSYELFDVNPEHTGRLVYDIDSGVCSSESVEDAHSGVQPKGVTIANELLDALPVYRLKYEQGALHELYVGLVNGWFSDVPRPPSTAALALLPESLGLAEGQIVELSVGVDDWMREVSNRFQQGVVIAIDYGYERPEIHDVTRFPTGTLKTYRQHEVGDNPYCHIGNQDITAHVDYSRVIESAESLGLQSMGLTTLAEFCVGLGMDRYLMELQRVASSSDYANARAAALALLDPGGLGRFKVAAFSRGLSDKATLRGLSFRAPGALR